MLLYFSATGNGSTLRIAYANASRRNKRAYPDCMRAGEFFGESSIGIDCSADYIISPAAEPGAREGKKAKFETPYLYLVASYGTTPGVIGAIANRAIAGAEIDGDIPFACRTLDADF